jgi:activator of HSP90 ATPase
VIVTITLTTAGTDTGPFNLYSDIDGFVSAFETGVSKAALLAGYTSTLVPNGTTIIRVMSANPLCTNFIDIVIDKECTTTTTTSSTSSTTSTTSTTSSTSTTTSTSSSTTTTTSTSSTTTTSTTTEVPPTTTTTTTEAPLNCTEYNVVGTPSISIEWLSCAGEPFTQTVGAGGIFICAETGTVVQTGGSGSITPTGPCGL